jgi:hypothetical protein
VRLIREGRREKISVVPDLCLEFLSSARLWRGQQHDSTACCGDAFLDYPEYVLADSRDRIQRYCDCAQRVGTDGDWLFRDGAPHEHGQPGNIAGGLDTE